MAPLAEIARPDPTAETDIETLRARLDPARLPQHVAIIMDGNGRWARKRHLPSRLLGHREGYKTVRRIVRAAADLGIPVLTLYVFSHENWRRPKHETDGLMALIEQAARNELRELHENGVRIRFVGRRDGLSDSLQREMDRDMAVTQNNDRITLNLAINYGGRAEIADAARRLAEAAVRGEIDPADITEAHLAAQLYAPDLPDPDLLIRTAGEMRVSNFLLWGIAYAEIWVTPTLWPDFTPSLLADALEDYQGRIRKFGAVVNPNPAGASPMKKIVILGATGSIGTQTLDVVRRLPDRLRVIGLSAHLNIEVLRRQAQEFGVSDAQLAHGGDDLTRLATLPDADLVVVAVAGAVGTEATLAALHAGKDVALATKEVMVAAGELVTAAARTSGARILPIDSEHSAIFQCLQGSPAQSVAKLWLTASGGPFREWSAERMAHATVAEASIHPTWPTMGRKITIDSATLMNKALEIIEARWLFDVPTENIGVVIHPQSVVHSGRFTDSAVLAQIGLPDMRLPIEYALLYPERIDAGLPRLDLMHMPALTFASPDETRFPSLGLGRRASAEGGTMPAVLNAANETAVSLFLEERIPFPAMATLIERVMDAHRPEPASALSDILQADAWARQMALRLSEQ